MSWPVKNAQFIFYVGLVSQASRPQFQANPTLAAGDVKVSTDGAAFANLGSLPAVTPASGRAVKVTLSNTEMNGDDVVVQFVDAAGSEWDELVVHIHTTTRGVDNLAYPTTSGRSMDVDASGGVEVGSFQAGALTSAAFAAGAINAAALAADAGAEIADAVWDEDIVAAHGTADTAGKLLNDVEAAVDTEIAAIKAKTDNLPTDPADQSALEAAIAAAQSAIQTDVAGVQSDTNDIQSRLPAALVSGRIDASVGAMAANTVTASALAADAVDEILDEVIEGSTTFRQMLRLFASALGGKLDGAATTTVTIRDLGDTKDRVTATVDANGNRTAITLDLT